MILPETLCLCVFVVQVNWVARRESRPPTTVLREASYRLLGLIRTKTVGTVEASSSWAPTQSVSTVLTLSTIFGTLIPSAIEIRFIPLDSRGEWRIDDLYIDPFLRS